MKNQNIIIKWLICFAIFGVQGLCLIASPIVHTLAADYPDVPLTTVRMITTIPSLAAFVGAMFLAPMLGKVLRYKTALECPLQLYYYCESDLRLRFCHVQYEKCDHSQDLR